MEFDQFVRQIEEAFPDQPLSDGELVTPISGIDAQGKRQDYVHPEALDVLPFFAGKHWHDLVGNPLLDWGAAASSSLNLLSIQGKIFYLPAYMLTVMSDIHSNPDLVEGLINVLTPPKVLWLDDEERQKLIASIADSGDRYPSELRDGLLEILKRDNYPEKEATLDIVDKKCRDFVGALNSYQKQTIRDFIAFMQEKYGDAVEDLTEMALSGNW